MQEVVIQTIIFIFLAVGSYFDIRTKKISRVYLLAFFTACLICIICFGDYANLHRYIGLSVGAVFCVISYLSRQAIGLGDAIVFAVLGFALGVYRMLFMLFLAFCLAAVTGVFLLFFKRIGRKTRIPFLPFLYISYACMCLNM